MPVPAESAPGSPALRCSACGAAVRGTEHGRDGWVVGYYLLRTGRTEEATFRRRDDEAPIPYRRLVTPELRVSCPACFGRPEVRRLWASFGDEA
jgi:hypothetical protein